MLSKKGWAYLVCFLGYLVIIFKGVPVFYSHRLFHINFLSNSIYYQYIDYNRFACYLVIWPVMCFIVYKTIAEIKIRKGQ